jgi:hypothetical protein
MGCQQRWFSPAAYRCRLALSPPPSPCRGCAPRQLLCLLLLCVLWAAAAAWGVWQLSVAEAGPAGLLPWLSLPKTAAWLLVPVPAPSLLWLHLPSLLLLLGLLLALPPTLLVLLLLLHRLYLEQRALGLVAPAPGPPD